MERDEFENQAMAELECIYRFARFLTGDSSTADDLVQDVYARAFRAESIAAFRARDGGMRSWLLTIARTAFYGKLDRERAGRRAMDRVAQTMAASSREAEAPLAHEVEGIDWGRVGPALGDAVACLSVELREVLWLWAVEGMKYREIGEAMGVPIGTVMSRLHRARTQAAAAMLGRESVRNELREARMGKAAGNRIGVVGRAGVRGGPMQR